MDETLGVLLVQSLIMLLLLLVHPDPPTQETPVQLLLVPPQIQGHRLPQLIISPTIATTVPQEIQAQAQLGTMTVTEMMEEGNNEIPKYY